MQRLTDRDLLSALVLFFIGSVALYKEGDDLMNWVFPRLATYFVLFAGAVMAARVIFTDTDKRVSEIIRVSAEDRLVALDVLVFLVIVFGYLLVMYGLGFWLASFVMLAAASIYLTLDKTRKNIGLAIVVPLGICIAAYIIFLHVFYVPVPEARWWAGFR